jgi:hypothetical protein
LDELHPHNHHASTMLIRQTGALLAAAGVASALRNASPFFMLSTEA